MRNYDDKARSLVFIFFLISFSGFAQLMDGNSILINQYFQSSKEVILNNEHNKVKSNIESQIGSVSLNQIGENNQIEINQKRTDTQSVNQKGTNNYYTYFNFYNSSVSNFNIYQFGESNSLQIYGDNAISRGMNIIQRSNFKTLIIKNY